MDFSPCIPLCIEEHLFTGARTAVSNVPAPEPTEPILQTFVGDIQLGHAGEGEDGHEEVCLKTRCMCSSCRRVVGSFRVSSSSSFSHPSTVTFLDVLIGRSSCSGRAEMKYLLAIHPISPCAQSLNCFFNKASEPWSSSLGMGNWTTAVPDWRI